MHERLPRWLAARWATFAFLAACAAGQPGPLGPGAFSGDAAPEDRGLLPNAGEHAGATAQGIDGGAEAGASSLLEDASATELGEIAIADEPPYAPGARRRPKSALAASSEDDVIARWNRGGPNGGAASDAKPPHPAP